MLRQRLTVTAVSTVYRTPAINRPELPDFLNCLFEAETRADVRSVGTILREIEDALGRRRGGEKFGSRRIDLDLLLYGDLVVDDGELKLPHPDLSRWFVRAALAELAPDLDVLARQRSGSESTDGGEREAKVAPAVTRSLREVLRA